MLHWKGMTNYDALAAWDAGEPIWTCEMGGLGPGYEQCIHIIGMEILRAMMDYPIDYGELDALPDSVKQETWRSYQDDIEAVPAVKAAIYRLDPSGAQFGAAMNIASVFARHGYELGMDMVPEDRRIQVSRTFPADAAGGCRSPRSKSPRAAASRSAATS